MNEIVQVITYLLQSCAEKDKKIEILQEEVKTLSIKKPSKSKEVKHGSD